MNRNIFDMGTLSYIGLGLVLTILVVKLIRIGVRASRRQEFKDWKINDVIIISAASSFYSSINDKVKSNAVPIVGWTDRDLYFKIGNQVYKTDWDCFKSNKSALWRRNYDECEKMMGTPPLFDTHVDLPEERNEKSKTIDGIPIETMNETLCQVYLQKAIDEEDYDTAELIRKRLENFK